MSTGAHGADVCLRRTFRCRCGCSYDADRWRALALVHTVPAERVQELALRWPAGLAVEVRRCRACGDLIARAAGHEPRFQA